MKVTVTVVRIVVNRVDVGVRLYGSVTRDEVRGPWAATTRPAATREKKEVLVGIVREREGKERRRVSGGKASAGRKSRGKG